MADNEGLRQLAEFVAGQEAIRIDKRVVRIEDVDYLVHNGDVRDVEHEVMLSKVQRSPTINVSTLQGAVDWWENMGSADEPDYIEVQTPQVIAVKSVATLDDGERDTYLVASYRTPEHLFSRWLSPGDLSLWLNSRFVETEARQKLLGHLGSGVKIEAAREVKDDGSAMQMKRTRGVKAAWTDEFKPVFSLAPMRTFTEIEQPELPCVFRVKNNSEDEAVEVKLVEADGGAWKAEAIARIGAWLREKLPDAIILA